MLEPTLTPNSHPEVSDLPQADLVAVGKLANRETDLLVAAEVGLRRLRYLRDLLLEGYHHALRPELLSRTLRTDRIALGIDLPELDTVALWSVRNSDGTVSIPFIEFIVTDLCRCLEQFREAATHATAEVLAELRDACREMETFLLQAAPDDVPMCALPRLSEVFVDEALLERLCGAGQLLDRVLGLCECLVPADRHKPGH
jgi:hypothetical protein